MKIIDREFKNYKKEAEVEIDLLIAMGYDSEEIFRISQYMINLIEPSALKAKARREKLNTINES